MAKGNPDIVEIGMATRFKPGDPRAGRRKKLPMTEAYEKIAHARIPEKIRITINKRLGVNVLSERSTWAEANAVRQFIEGAVSGNTKASAEIANRLEGKPRQTIDVLHGTDDPLSALLDEFRNQYVENESKQDDLGKTSTP